MKSTTNRTGWRQPLLRTKNLPRPSVTSWAVKRSSCRPERPYPGSWQVFGWMACHRNKSASTGRKFRTPLPPKSKRPARNISPPFGRQLSRWVKRESYETNWRPLASQSRLYSSVGSRDLLLRRLAVRRLSHTPCRTDSSGSLWGSLSHELWAVSVSQAYDISRGESRRSILRADPLAWFR